jgi:hypothetical protein
MKMRSPTVVEKSLIAISLAFTAILSAFFFYRVPLADMQKRFQPPHFIDNLNRP